MSLGLRSLLDSAKKLAINGPGSSPTPMAELFAKTDPAVDGDDCSHDCASCTQQYPRGFKIDHDDHLYGLVKGWSTHLVVATGKTDWVRDVADEKGSVMEAVDRAAAPANGRLMLSASNMPTPSHATGYDEPTRVLLLPAFVLVDNVTPALVPGLLDSLVSKAPTTKTPLLPPTPPLAITLPPPLACRPSPHSVVVLLCSQKTRDARCGQSAPLLRKELERHLRPLGLFRDLDDERPGGVGIYFISHVGGHKYSANMLIYRRPDAFGLDTVAQGQLSAEERAALPARIKAAGPAVLRRAAVADKDKETVEADNAEADKAETAEETSGANAEAAADDGCEVLDTVPGAAQCIWLARIAPVDCENIVKYTILQGKVVKPESQLRGGFDRSKGLFSW